MVSRLASNVQRPGYPAHNLAVEENPMYRFLPLILVLGCPRSQEEVSAEPAPDAPAPSTEAAGFSAATSGELGLMLLAGYGGDVFLASNAYSAAHVDAEIDGCPVAALTADGYELTAVGCEATASGRVWNGRLVIHNPNGLPELSALEGAEYGYDPSLPLRIEFMALSADLEGEQLSWDGSLEFAALRRGTLIDVEMTTTSGADRPVSALTTFGCGLPDDPSWCGPIGEENLLFIGDDLEIVPSMDPDTYALLLFEAGDEVLSINFTDLDTASGCVSGELLSGGSVEACMPNEEIVDVDPEVGKVTDEDNE
ncbi:hypothetical protein LBMAG42_55130 [Deltaproteobacteria bacterium]|nr:hypothetical protein LBMAG42_55130 [Deltaproteobacteria bacterium]